jgi:flagellar protein FliO/FliZ
MLSSISPILTALAAMAAVLALIWLAQRAARWTGMARRPAGTRLLAMEDALALDARRRLVVVRCGDRRCLLLTGGTQDLVVGWLP